MPLRYLHDAHEYSLFADVGHTLGGAANANLIKSAVSIGISRGF